MPEHLTVTAGRGDQAKQHADRGGLAGTVRADKPRYPTFGQVEVDRVDCPKLAEVLGQTEVRIEACVYRSIWSCGALSVARPGVDAEGVRGQVQAERRMKARISTSSATPRL